MADNKAPEFIGREALTHVAEQVGKQIIMGPAYEDPELLDRLGISVISGVQFKKTDHLLVRKGGTTRRKKVGTPVENKIGFLKERTLIAKLTWNRYKDNIDNYVETVFGTDGKPGGDYPMSTVAVEAILKSYAEDLKSNLFFGDMENEDSLDEDKQKLSLYDGFHTDMAHDIADGIISVQNKNLIPCDAISAPTDAHDSTPFDTALEWYTKWDGRLRQQKLVKLHVDILRGLYIAQGYANKYHGNAKVNYLPNGNFTVPEIEDAQDVIFQIQSIQGTRIMNPLPSAFVMSDGSIAENVINGDYENSKLVVTLDGADEGAKVQVNGQDYPKALEFAPNALITLKAVEGSAEGHKVFKQWSNGKTEKEITITATGMPMAITAFYQ